MDAGGLSGDGRVAVVEKIAEAQVRMALHASRRVPTPKRLAAIAYNVRVLPPFPGIVSLILFDFLAVFNHQLICINLICSAPAAWPPWPIVVHNPFSSFLQDCLGSATSLSVYSLPLFARAFGLYLSPAQRPLGPHATMSKQRNDQLAAMMRDLLKVQGVERLKIWMDYTRYQGQDADEQVSCKPRQHASPEYCTQDGRTVRS